MRLLLLLDAAAEPADDDPEAPEHVVGVVPSQVRLQKLDFWVRNPDYLANELLNEYERDPESPGLIDEAERILASEEPDLRRFPMLRHRFGAFEHLDNAMSVLVERGLARKRQRLGRTRVIQHRYYLLDQGRMTAASLVIDAPALSWYVERIGLVVHLVDGVGGTRIKERQYLQRDYAGTAIRSYIPAITDAVRARLTAIRAAGVTKARPMEVAR